MLAVDTATETIGVGLHNGRQVLADSVWRSSRYHTVELAPQVALLLRRAQASPRELTALAVTEGPGSYTGLRIGMALAKGLALVHNLPLVGISTFEALARQQPQRPEPMLSVIHAGRNRILAMWYKWGRHGWQAQGKALNTTWEEVVETVESQVYLCGEIPPETRAQLEEDPRLSLAPPSLCVRRPSELAELAWAKLHRGVEGDPMALHPVYINTIDGEAA